MELELQIYYNISRLGDLSQEERKTAMQNLNEELKAWAEENGLNQNLLLLGHGMGGPRGGHFGLRSGGFAPGMDSGTDK